MLKEKKLIYFPKGLIRLTQMSFEKVLFYHLPGKCNPKDYINALFNDLIKKKPHELEDSLYTTLCKRVTNKFGIIFIPSIESIMQNYALKYERIPNWEDVEFQVAMIFEETKRVFVDDEKTSYLEDLLSKYGELLSRSKLLVKEKPSVINKEDVREIGLGFKSNCDEVGSILQLIKLQYVYEEGYSLCREEIDHNILVQKDREKESKISFLKNIRDEKKKRRGLKTVSSDLQPSVVIEEESPESKRAREELEWEEQERDKQQQLKMKKKYKKKMKNKVKKDNKKKAEQFYQVVFPKWKQLFVKSSQINNLHILVHLKNGRLQNLIKIQKNIRHYLYTKKQRQLITRRWKQLSVKVSQRNKFQELIYLRDSRLSGLIKIQGIIRSQLCKRTLIRLKNRFYKSILIQTLYRTLYYSRKWARIKEACLKIQTTCRMWKLYQNYHLKQQQKSLELEKKTQNRVRVLPSTQLCQPVNQSHPPVQMCRYFKKSTHWICPWGKLCRYAHGEEDMRNLQKTISESECVTECWFGRGCTKVNCPYPHPNGRVAFPSSS